MTVRKLRHSQFVQVPGLVGQLQVAALGSTQVRAGLQTAGRRHTLWLPHGSPSALTDVQSDVGIPPLTGQRPTVHSVQTVLSPASHPHGASGPTHSSFWHVLVVELQYSSKAQFWSVASHFVPTGAGWQVPLVQPSG